MLSTYALEIREVENSVDTLISKMEFNFVIVNGL